MLNRVILMGRITQDLELKTTQSGVSVLSFTVAVDRSFVRQGEERQTDFIDCVAWRQTAEFINRYFGKGRMIAIEGSLQKRSYDDRSGNKRWVTEVVVDNASFTGEPKQQSGGDYQPSYQSRNENSYQRNDSPKKPAFEEPDQKPISIGDMSDFEDILSSDGVPF